MAKKSYKEPLEEIFDQQIDLIADEPVVQLTEDPVADKVSALRAKGYDNNRIAALLGIHVQKLDSM